MATIQGEDALENEEELEQTKEWVVLKDGIEAEKDAIEALKDGLELLKDDLEARYEAAKDSGDLELAAGILAEIEGVRTQIQSYKLEMKEKIQNMHEVMKQQYTAEELSADPSLTVLPVENIYFTGGTMKFDTPPVIKDGRTLIPIRSISTALGAEVTWNSEERKAVIEYGDAVIEFNVDEGIVYLNGQETEIDVPAKIMNGRIVVPLRFVIENMDLEVEWEQETQTIIISEEQV
jgi:hypothetical protein